MQPLGNLSITMYLINPTEVGQHHDDVFARRMRRVNIFRKYQVTLEEARAIKTQFLTENHLSNSDLYQIDSVWTVTEVL